MRTYTKVCGVCVRMVVYGLNLSVRDDAKCDVHDPTRWGGNGDDHLMQSGRCLQQSQLL
jgi:hypothetical protein